MVGDKELSDLRQKYYGLFVNLFWKEPEVELLRSLLEGISQRIKATEKLSVLMSEGWEKIRIFLEESGPEEVEYEFVQLFIGPQKPEVMPYESYYFTGSVFQAPLSSVRRFMKEVGLEKKEGELPEPEDTLGFELEIMNWLISKQISSKDSKEEEMWLNYQESFLKKHLLIWGTSCCKDVESSPKADFYKGAGMLLNGFFEIEKDLFENRGPEKIESLEDVRKRFGNRRDWKGPLFEATKISEGES